jgi:ABC-type sugar transport system substrate-binding protein
MARIGIRSGRRRGIAASAVSVMIAAGLVAGCGSSSSNSSSSSPSKAAGTASSSTAQSGGGAVATAQHVATLAETKLLYGPTTGPATASQLHAPTAADINVLPYKPPSGKSIVFVSCSAESGQCTHSAEIGKAFLAKMGISSTVVQSNYTPAGNQQAMNTALAMKPDAIIMLAIAPSTIGAQIAQAKAQHVPVVDGYGTEPIDGGDLSAYVPQGSSLYQIASGAEMIAAAGAKANVLWYSAPEFPELEVPAGISFFKSTCPTCHLATGTVTAAQVTSPVTTGQVITAGVRANSSLNYVSLPSGCADLQAAAAAARGVGSTKVAAPGCGASSVSAMNAGDIPYATGEVEPWGTLAAIDQVFRLWAGKPPLPASQTGPAAYLVTPSTTPDKSTNVSYGKIDRWTLSLFDYLAPYEKAWKVNLHSVIQSEQ